MPVCDRLNIYIYIADHRPCLPASPRESRLGAYANEVRETAKQRGKGKQEDKRAVSPEKSHWSPPYLQQQVRA